MRKAAAMLLGLGLLLGGPAALGAGPAVALDQAPLDAFDFASKQRGAKL